MLIQIKLAIGASIIVAFGVLYWMYDSAVADNELLTVKYEQIVARTERDAAKIKEITATAEQNNKLHIEAAAKVQDNLDQVKTLESIIAEQKESYNELVKKFADHDFENLVTERQATMQRLMRVGTKRVFGQLEKATARNSSGVP